MDNAKVDGDLATRVAKRLTNVWGLDRIDHDEVESAVRYEQGREQANSRIEEQPEDSTGADGEKPDCRTQQVEQCPFVGYSHIDRIDKRCAFIAGHCGSHGIVHYIYHPNHEAPKDE